MRKRILESKILRFPFRTYGTARNFFSKHQTTRISNSNRRHTIDENSFPHFSIIDAPIRHEDKPEETDPSE